MSNYFGTKKEKIIQAREKGEKELQEHLIKNRISVIPTNQMDSVGAPMLQGIKKLILPDKFCCIMPTGKIIQNNFWVEVKDKPQFDWWAITGFDERLLEHYKAVQKNTKMPVLVVFRDNKEWEERVKTIRRYFTFKDNEGNFVWYGEWLDKLIPYAKTRFDKKQQVSIIAFPVSCMRPIDLIIDELKNQTIFIKGWD